MFDRNEVWAYYREHVEDVTDECMIWPYARYPNTGYGRIYFPDGGGGTAVHILSCTVWHGERPVGMQAAHGPCHDRLCWNGQHLSWKTPAENSRDKVRDGTLLNGTRHYAAKVTEAQVVEMRARYAAGGLSHRDLAGIYGLALPTVGDILRRRTWHHV